MKKKRALLFDSINFPIVIFCYLLSPFFSKVFFRYSKKKVFIPFSKNFFVKIGYSGVDGSLFNKSYHLKRYLIKRYLEKIFYKKIFFINFCKLINLDEKYVSKLIFSFENFLYQNNILSIDASSYVYSKKFLKDFSIIYMPNYISSYLLFSQTYKKRFKTISLLAYFNGISFFFRFLIYDFTKILINKIKNKFTKGNKNIQKNIYYKNQIGYFPHKNLKYGSFFSKTFFYKNKENSIFDKLGVDTIFFEKTDKVSEKYLKIHKKQKITLRGETSRNFLQFFIKYLLFIFNNKKYIRLNKIPLFIFFLLFYLKIERYNTTLKKFSYKFFFFYNDYTIPNTLLISTAINNIKTISFQDRLTSYVYNNKIICDYYFTCGSYFNKIFNKKYSAEKLLPIGLLRSNLIDENLIRNRKFFLRVNSIKKNKKVVSLILITSTNNQKSDLYGEDGSSIKSLLNFENLIYNLEKNFKNKIHIVIKFKDTNFLYQDEFYEFEKRLKKFDNVEIIKSNNISSANIISISDIVIGSQSTIIEESLMKKKYSFIFDMENFASTLGFYRHNKFYILKSIEKVVVSLLLIFNDDKEYIDNYNKNRKTFIKNYLSDEGKINSFDTLREKIIDCINEKL